MWVGAFIYIYRWIYRISIYDVEPQSFLDCSIKGVIHETTTRGFSLRVRTCMQLGACLVIVEWFRLFYNSSSLD